MAVSQILRFSLCLMIALALLGGFLNVHRFRVQAQSISADISNQGPTILAGTEKICDNSVPIANTDIAITACPNISSISLDAGSARPLTFFAKARDLNTNVDIPSGPFVAVLYHDTTSDTGNPACSNDKNNCYQLTCSKVVNIATGGNTDAWLRCDFDLEYYADHSLGPSQWVGYIEVYDQSLVGGNNGGGYVTEVEKLVSGTFPFVDFGTRTQGTVTGSGNNTAILHQNNGNVVIDFLVSLDDDDADASLDCAVGNLPASNITFDIDDVGFAGSAYTLTAEPTAVALNINVQQRTNDAAPLLDDAIGDIKRSYWNVNVPTSGPFGFCDEGLNVTVFEAP